jgi:hypothetical protein
MENINHGLDKAAQNVQGPDSVVSTHSTDGVVYNRLPMDACPQRAVDTGPERVENDPINWVESNFSCQ